MLPFRVLPEARHELLEAAQWYREEDGLVLARAFGAAYREQLARARKLPQSGHPIPMPADVLLDLRSFLLARFPYKLVIAAADEVVVLAVAHQRRRPFYWAPRIEKVDP